MAEVQNYLFDYKEIAEALIQKQGIHDGLWGIYLEFGIGAGLIPLAPSGDTLVPAAIIPVQKIGIQRFDAPNSLTVDAAKINPAVGETPTAKKSATPSHRKGTQGRARQDG